MEIFNINSEHPSNHWPILDVAGKKYLDMGCGSWGFGMNDTTPIYFANKGASEVVGIDILEAEINNYRNFISTRPDADKFTFIHKGIDSPETIKELLEEYKPQIVKCDIEGYETNFYDLDFSIFSSIEQIGIECHGVEILRDIQIKLEEVGFAITHKGIFPAPWDYIAVLFASRL